MLKLSLPQSLLLWFQANSLVAEATNGMSIQPRTHPILKIQLFIWAAELSPRDCLVKCGKWYLAGCIGLEVECNCFLVISLCLTYLCILISLLMFSLAFGELVHYPHSHSAMICTPVVCVRPFLHFFWLSRFSGCHFPCSQCSPVCGGRLRAFQGATTSRLLGRFGRLLWMRGAAHSFHHSLDCRGECYNLLFLRIWCLSYPRLT